MSDVRLTATNPEDSSAVPVACNSKGELLLQEIPDQEFDGNLDGDLSVTGSAEFAGGIESAGIWVGKDNKDGYLNVTQGGGGLAAAINIIDGAGRTTAVITANGSAEFRTAEFAGGKAGFTAEGYLWCTTRRGDTVILDATSNGLATWADYTPSRRDLIKEKVEAWSEKDTNDPNFGVSPEDTIET